MSQIEEHLKWCLKDERRLVKIASDGELAEKHLAKSEYNYRVMQTLERLEINDWALNVGFYAPYHCFLAILTKYGHRSRNQSCTVTAVLTLIDEKKLNLDKDIILQFDTLEPEKDLVNPTVRENREVSTYGVGTSVDLYQLKHLKELIIRLQRETIRILNE